MTPYPYSVESYRVPRSDEMPSKVLHATLPLRLHANWTELMHSAEQAIGRCRWSYGYTPSMIKDRFYFLAFMSPLPDTQEIVGMASCFLVEYHQVIQGIVSSVFVAPAHQRKHIGLALLEEIDVILRHPGRVGYNRGGTMGTHSLQTFVPATNYPAQQLFVRGGYTLSARGEIHLMHRSLRR